MAPNRKHPKPAQDACSDQPHTATPPTEDVSPARLPSFRWPVDAVRIMQRHFDNVMTSSGQRFEECARELRTAGYAITEEQLQGWINRARKGKYRPVALTSSSEEEEDEEDEEDEEEDEDEEDEEDEEDDEDEESGSDDLENPSRSQGAASSSSCPKPGEHFQQMPCGHGFVCDCLLNPKQRRKSANWKSASRGSESGRPTRSLSSPSKAVAVSAY